MLQKELLRFDYVLESSGICSDILLLSWLDISELIFPEKNLAWLFFESIGKFLVCWWYGCRPNSHPVNVGGDCMALVCRAVYVYQKKNFSVKEKAFKVFQPYNYR